MIALIRAALEGLSAIPKILDFFVQMNIAARLNSIEKNQEAMRGAFTKIQNAKSSDEFRSAVADLSSVWNRP